ncbi:hypothetical protein D3C78_524100 [compost metagenome]
MRHDVQVAKQLATGAVPIAQAQQQLAGAGARRHQRQHHGQEQQDRAADTGQDGAGLGLMAGCQAQRRRQRQAAGLTRRQQGFAQISQEGGQKVGAGGDHADPQQLGSEEVSQGEVAGQQRQQDEPDPHHDHERDQPCQAGRARQLMFAQGPAVTYERH